MRKLLLAEHSDVRAEALSKELQKEWNIHVCTNSTPIHDTLKYINPEAMIINLNIGPKDGLQVLDESFTELPPVILALTNFESPYILDKAESLGVGCVVRVPCNTKYVADRLEDMFAAYLDRPSITARHLKVLGINPKLSGYRCLLIAIPLYAANTNQLLKEIYPEVAKLCGLNDSRCVERVIRTAIADAWLRRNPSLWAAYFPTDEKADVDLPSNKLFISQLAQKV